VCTHFGAAIQKNSLFALCGFMYGCAVVQRKDRTMRKMMLGGVLVVLFGGGGISVEYGV